MKTPTHPRRAALDPSLSLLVDRYECSMVAITPFGGRHGCQRISRAITVGLGAVAATIGGYFLQLGR